MINTKMITRKRRFAEETDSGLPSKKQKINIDWDIMVSASKVRNYLLEEPLLDWLKEFNIINIKSQPIKRQRSGITNYNNLSVSGETDFTQFIMNQGLLFESKVYEFLKRKHQVVQIAESYQAHSIEKYNETIKYMKAGAEIIYQGVLHDYENQIYGCPDLLVRSDRFNDIFQKNYLNNEEALVPSPLLKTPFHYIVVDIKHSTLYLTSNGINLRNCNSIPAYKGQILVYNMALGSMQGYRSQYGYVLGKKWVYSSKQTTFNGDDFMNTLGVIDYENYDNVYYDKVKNAIKWICDMRLHGHNWSLLPTPSRPELYPNMKNEKDGKWRKIKNELNQVIYDITSVWMCGVKRRTIGHNKAIYSWKNNRCTALNLEFNQGKISKTVNHILKINRQNKDLIRVNSLIHQDNWRYFGEDVMEFYLDYETINSNMGQCILSGNNYGYNSNDIIFMVGLGWNKNNKWEYKKFIITQNNKNAELDMIKTFWKFVDNKLIEENKSESVFIHWTKAEPQFYNKLLARHQTEDLPKKNFYDLYDLFRNNNIVVKGALNFSLKTIANAMYDNKLIKTCWDRNNPCSNGLNAMLMAYKLYKHNNSVSGNEPVMKDIIHYNEIDCKVLWEILMFLRNTY
jgi:hypothetical protein